MIVERARCLLLDFDGPICGVFANYSAPAVAAELRRVLVDQGVTAPTVEVDPLEVLRSVDQPDLTRRVDDALRAAELLAVRSAEPTPYAREVIMAGKRVAIVSNNSAEAIRAYLTAHGLADHVHAVVGRAYADLSRMKPSPWPVFAALRELGAQPDECVLVGDSVGDVVAARAARVPVIGYANKPGKRARLAEAGADQLIDGMADLIL